MLSTLLISFTLLTISLAESLPPLYGRSCPEVSIDNTMKKQYTHIFPPRPSRVDQTAELRLRSCAGKHHSEYKVDEAVLFLDLDKTAIFGNDGNDLGMALQWMEQPESVVKSLYRHLVNPNIRPAYEAMKQRAKKVHVVIYTRRPQVVHYRSCFRDAVIPVRYKREWHSQDGQICFPAHLSRANDISRHYCGPERLDEEKEDMDKALERMLAARDAIAAELNLDVPPRVVVTASEKCVDSTASALGLPRANAFLFDDNAQIQHHHNVICVDALESLPRSRRDTVVAFMEEHLPVAACDDDLIEYLQGAKPGEQAIECNDDDAWQWRVPVMEHAPAPWRTPDIAPDLRRSGTMSPVTPWSEGSSGTISRSEAADPAQCREAVDLRLAVERAVQHRQAAKTDMSH